MKIALASDLHLEFAQVEIKNPGDVDLLILSGDIMLACVLPENRTDDQSRTYRRRFTQFFKQVSAEFPQIMYVMGNHEHYHGDFPQSATQIREFMLRNNFHNVTLLDKEKVHFKEFVIFGATLWTDFNYQDPGTMTFIKTYLNDYRVIEDSRYPPVIHPYDRSYGRKNMLTPSDTLKEHIQTRISLGKAAELGEPTIIIGHHSPSFRSVHADFKDDKLGNGAYHSDLEHLMDRYRNIKLWTHGHTHYEFDYQIHDTRVVCNPRGYEGHEISAKNFKLKVIEL
jgi:predicted phosphodiesterase